MYSDTVVDLMLNNKVVNKETNEESAAPIVSPVLGASDKLEEANDQRYLYISFFRRIRSSCRYMGYNKTNRRI